MLQRVLTSWPFLWFMHGFGLFWLVRSAYLGQWLYVGLNALTLTMVFQMSRMYGFNLGRSEELRQAKERFVRSLYWKDPDAQ